MQTLETLVVLDYLLFVLVCDACLFPLFVFHLFPVYLCLFVRLLWLFLCVCSVCLCLFAQVVFEYLLSVFVFVCLQVGCITET